MSNLVEQHGDSLPNVARQIVALLPNAWQYPKLCHARVAVQDEHYETPGFHETSWRQVAAIRLRRQTLGRVEVFFQESPEQWDDTSYLLEQQVVVRTAASHIARVSERCSFLKELSETREALHEAKAALRGIFSQINEERAEIGRTINANVERVLLPQIHALANQVSSHQIECLSLLEKGVTDLTDPFTHRLSKLCQTLTPAEIEVCNMIRGGMTTKEIARVRHVTSATVFKQRESIRRKLSILGSRTNLTAHLLGVAAKAS